MPLEVQSCLLRPAYLARYGPLGEMLAPAIRTAAIGRLAANEGVRVNVWALMPTGAIAYDDDVSREDLSSFVQDYVAELPFSVLSAWSQHDDVELRPPYGEISGIIFAAATRASRRARLTWWSGLDQDRVFLVSRGLRAAPPSGKSPLERTFPCTVVLSILESLDVARNLLATFAQPGGHAAVRGMNSFAEFPAHAGPADPVAGAGFGFGLRSLVSGGRPRRGVGAAGCLARGDA